MHVTRRVVTEYITMEDEDEENENKNVISETKDVVTEKENEEMSYVTKAVVTELVALVDSDSEDEEKELVKSEDVEENVTEVPDK